MQFSGTLKFLNHQRGKGGFGFICRDGEDIDDFIHISALDEAGIKPESLEGGKTRLAYDLVQDRKNQKLKAANVSIID
jgi:CspA family cold shock protein